MAEAPDQRDEQRFEYLDYTWMISGILYQGGTDILIPELMSRGINEIFFHNVAGAPIAKKLYLALLTPLTWKNFLLLSLPTRQKIFLILFFIFVGWTNQILA